MNTFHTKSTVAEVAKTFGGVNLTGKNRNSWRIPLQGKTEILGEFRYVELLILATFGLPPSG